MKLLNRDEVIEALDADIHFSIESDYDLTKLKPEFQKFADEMIKAQEKAINELEPASDAVQVVRCDDCVSMEKVLKEIHRLWNCSGDKDYCMETLRDFVSELPPVTPTQSWSPVSERLPEDFQRVLVTIVNYAGYNVVRVAEYHSGKETFQIKENHERWKVGEKGLLAWMPLPEPFSEGEYDSN